MKRKLTLLFFICSAVLKTLGQDGPTKVNIIPPSPNSAALVKYVEFPASQSTGIPQISLPIGVLEGKTLNVPITLSYHAGGAKVEEVASWAGIGWSLNAGGVITRTIRGLPDELANGNLTGYDHMTQRISDHLNHVYSADDDRFFQRYCADGLFDTQPDQYFFSFQGKSGKIIWDENGVGTAIPYQKLKITKNDLGFTIIDEAGIKYIFEASEFTETMDACETYTIPEVVSSWHLASITTPSGETASFGYERGITYQPINPLEIDYHSILCQNTMPNGGCLKLFRITTARLSTISIGKKTVNFIANTKRTDLPANSIEFRLDGIEFRYDNTLIKKFLLDYNPVSTTKLMLGQVTQYDPFNNALSNLLYKFDYISPGNIPPTTGKAQDHWGFYNNNGAGTLLPAMYMLDAGGHSIFLPGADRSPNFQKTQVGVLNKITYATGGYSSFEYELNSYGFINQTKVAGWEQITSSVLATADPQTPSAEKTFVIDSVQNITMDYQINTTVNGGLYPSINEYVSLVNVSTNTTVAIIASGTGNISYMLGPGTYKLTAYSENPTTFTTAKFDYKTRSSIPIVTKPIGGLRIAKITDHDGLGGGEDLIRTYKYVMTDEPSRSSGTMGGEPYYVSYYEQLLSGKQPGTCNYFVRAATPLALGIAQGAYVSYREVREERSNGAGTLSKFTTFYDAGDGGGIISVAPSTSYDYFRGLLLEQTNYKTVNGVSVPVNSLTNHYKLDPPENYKVQKGFTVVCTRKSMPFLLDLYQEYPWENISQWFYQDGTKNITYDVNGLNPVVTEKAFKYDNAAHAQPTRVETYKSNGTKSTELTVYPLDYAAGTTFIDDMNNNHLVALPIEKVTYQTNAAGENRIISGNIIKYLPGAKGLKDEEFLLNTLSGEPLAGFKFSNRSTGILPLSGPGSAYSMDAKYESRLKINAYDGYSNILEYQAPGSAKTAVLWNYDNSFPMAQFKNAAYNEIAYTSFEAESKGNWTYTGNAIVSLNAPDGKTVYELSTGALSKGGLDAAKKYTLGYYTQNATPFAVSGTSDDVVKNTLANGWFYFEHSITGVSAVSLSGSGLVDDVKLHPSQSLMTSYTLNPMIGLSSQSDEKGKNTYYEYDSFQRLLNIKDQNGNIIKNYNYHYADPGNDTQVPGKTYSSAAASGTFTRNNCTTGGVPGTYTYTIPEGTYTSTISQDDADAKAISQVNSNGQNMANNNAGCTFSNAVLTQTFTRNNCASGGVAGTYTYTIPAGSYTSTISQDDAQSQAQNAMNVNGQAAANANASCTFKSDAMNQVFKSNLCVGAEVPSDYNYVIPAGKYTSTLSLNDANAQARADLAANGQAMANSNGSCNCTGEMNKRIGGYCQTGTRVTTNSEYNSRGRYYVCTYHYEWSDGSRGEDLTEQNPNPCPVN